MPPIDTIPLPSIFPFIIFLLSIAVMPLAFPRFWEKNRNKAIITIIVSLPAFVFLSLNYRIELIHNLKDYISFIILLASLFIISGGILMRGDLRATPPINSIFLIIGAIFANFIGTTGASMMLIRPVLKTNSERKHTKHIVVFFIFIVSNIGGCLTPLGDPPLFLGYLKGVPLAWTLGLLPQWVVTLGIILLIFFIWDTICYKKESPKDVACDMIEREPLGISGKVNLLFLAGVILAVFFQVPAPYREFIMVAMTILSLVFTQKELRDKNGFTFYPIFEVAILFEGIFVTMVPLLILLKLHGAELGITKSWHYFWATGGLSSFLDNAPTYLTFFSLAESVTQKLGPVGMTIVAGVKVEFLRAISLGAVFMGANTYIGNGPNFMVKSIAEQQGAKVPHFFEYMMYSGLILIPVFIFITLIFFSH